MEDLTGKQLNQYQIISQLGEGGMAAVYKAYQLGKINRYVALKILPRQLRQDPEFAGRFSQEANILAGLQHPHILPIFDYGEADGYSYLAMPLIESGTAADLLHGRPLPLPQIRNVIVQVADALDYAHAQGLIHRDVKPSNVLVDERGNCLLTDFGVSKIIEATTKFTHTSGIIGTPAYMSPEQGRGEKIDGRSDIYALGIMLYEMATGRVPFEAETPVAVVFKHIQEALPLPTRLNPDLPRNLETVILKALAKRPEDRYQTGAEMVRAIQAAIPESGNSAEHQPSHTELPPRPSSPRQSAQAAGQNTAGLPGWLASLLGFVAVTALGAIALYFISGNERPTAQLTRPETTDTLVNDPEAVSNTFEAARSPSGENGDAPSMTSETASSTAQAVMPAIEPTPTLQSPIPSDTPTATTMPSATPEPPRATPTFTSTPDVPTLTAKPEPSETPVPIANVSVDRIIESFEYPSSSSLLQNYWINAPGNELELSLAGPPFAVLGQYALAMKYRIDGAPPADYVGIEHLPMAAMDWRSYSAVCFWVRNDHFTGQVIFQFRELSGQVWKSEVSAAAIVAQEVCLPLNKGTFFLAQDPAGNKESIELDAIDNFAFYLGGGGQDSGFVYLDALQLRP